MMKKTNILTNIALVMAIIMMALLPLPTVDASSFTVSKSSVTVKAEETSNITVRATKHTGMINITSSDPEVATVDVNNLWVENDSKTITISGKATGTATITIKGQLYDLSIDGEEEYTKTIDVTVVEAGSGIAKRIQEIQ